MKAPCAQPATSILLRTKPPCAQSATPPRVASRAGCPASQHRASARLADGGAHYRPKGTEFPRKPCLWADDASTEAATPPVHCLASNSAPASCRNVSRETFVRTYLATNLPAIPSLGLFFMQRNVLAVAKKLRIRKDSCDSGAHRAQKRESDLQCSGVMREVAFQRVRGSRRNFRIRYLFAMRNAVECTGREGGCDPCLNAERSRSPTGRPCCRFVLSLIWRALFINDTITITYKTKRRMQ